jgi:hypothetical protein
MSVGAKRRLLGGAIGLAVLGPALDGDHVGSHPVKDPPTCDDSIAHRTWQSLSDQWPDGQEHGSVDR